jgi:hypothetical protein
MKKHDVDIRMLVTPLTGILLPSRSENVPKKTDADKMLGPQSAADAVKKRIAEIRGLSDVLSNTSLQMARAMKNIGKLGPNSGRTITITSANGGESFASTINLQTVGDFTREDKLVIIDQMTELAIEYLRREAAATYSEIQRLGKEL